jgi:hypothetical protein
MEPYHLQISSFLSKLINIINPQIPEFTLYDWKLLKGKLSGKTLAEKLKLNEALLMMFEDTLYNYEKFKTNEQSQKSVSLRLLLWLETISDNLNIDLTVDLPSLVNNEDTSLKQVRAIELILRSLVHEQIGSNDEVITVLGKIFNNDVIQKWQSNAEKNNILSGTTFSELSNILLNKNIFLSIEEIFSDPSLAMGSNNRESLRYVLEDVRIIRNSLAHNKKLTTIQIEVLNNHFNLITSLIQKSDKSKIEILKFFDDTANDLKNYLSQIQSDNHTISGYVEDINEKTNSILTLSNKLNRKSSIIIALVALVVLITSLVLYLQRETNKTTDNIAESTQNIDANVTKVIKRFDQLEGAIKSANPIANPKSANDFILNAYIFKNAGETEKSIEMFNKYLGITKIVRFDLYNDYYQLLKLTFSQKYAEERTKAELNSDMISAVIIYNEVYGEEAIEKISKLKLSTNLQRFLFLVKSNEIKTNYISYTLYPYYLKVMETRLDLGKQFEKVSPFFFDSKGPLTLLRDNNWSEIRGEIIMGYSLYQYAVKAHNSSMKEFVKQDYDEYLMAAAKIYESNPNGSGMSVKNLKAYIRCGTDAKLNSAFRTMP